MVSAGHPGWEHTEYVTDADPTDPNHVMVCSMRFSQEKNQLTTVVYVSFDGGRSWTLGYDDSSSRFAGVWDPACAFGVNRHAFFLTLVQLDSVLDDKRSLRLYGSNDGGRKWESLNRLATIDRPNLTIDRTDGHYRGRMYLYGDPSAGDPKMTLMYSSDGGRTWIRSETEGQESMKEWGAGTILPNGILLLPYVLNNETQLAIAASTDGGAHIGPPSTVPQWRGCGGFATMASDDSSGQFRGRAFVAWSGLHHGRCAAFVSYSDDQGKAWSIPIRASDASPQQPLQSHASERLMPSIAVNKNGILGLAWYDLEEKATAPRYRLRFSASLDGGETWLRSVAVSTHAFIIKYPPEFSAQAIVTGGGRRRQKERSDEVDLWVWPSARNAYAWNTWPGDYAVSISAAADGKFQAFWIDNRTRTGELHTARVTVNGVIPRLCGQELNARENITSALEVQYTSSVWNPRTKTVSLQYQLLNTSRDTIDGPLKMRIVQLESDLGVPTVVFANGRNGGAGTVLDLLRAIPPSGLGPGQTSLPQRLLVKFDHVKQLRRIDQRDVVHMKVKVYGRRRST